VNINFVVNDQTSGLGTFWTVAPMRIPQHIPSCETGINLKHKRNFNSQSRILEKTALLLAVTALSPTIIWDNSNSPNK
jgi:hypothetical protein